MEPRVAEFQPAKIQIKSKSGGLINVNIGRITGSCSVGNRNHITIIKDQSQKPAAKTVKPTLGSVDSSDSDSDSDSSDDSDVDRWFKEVAGCEKPPGNKFKEAMKHCQQAKELFKDTKVQGQSFQTLIMTPGQPPEAFDAANRQVQIKTTQLTNGFSVPASSGTHADPPTKGADAAFGKEATKMKIMSGITNAEQLVSKDLILKISPHFGLNWRRVFRHLEMPDAMIDLQHLQGGQLQDTVYQLLLQWTQSCDRPTVGCLVEALFMADYHNVIQVIQTTQ